jgi:hypothetical protein
MIRLKNLLREITDTDLKQLFQKINNNEFKFIGHGDNGRVYEFEGEDKVFKVTTSLDELDVAKKIQNKFTQYSTFIPVYWVGEVPNSKISDEVIIMANANTLPSEIKRKIDDFVDSYKSYLYDEGGESSVFDFLESSDITIDPQIKNFLDALRNDVQKLNITDLDLDLDFKSDNIMLWNGKLIMVDW